jgi:hypothetical protein
MSLSTELRFFRGVVMAIAAAIAFVVGPTGAFGGVDGVAALLGRDPPVGVDPVLRNHLRAICGAFAGFGLLAVWSIGALDERRNAFRIVVAVGVAIGLARVTGWIVDGDPGALAKLFLATEVVLLPLLLLWHERLLRLGREQRPGPTRGA